MAAATKQELIDEANKRGIVLTGDETVADLKTKLDADDAEPGTDKTLPDNQPVKSHAQEERDAVSLQTGKTQIHEEAREMNAKQAREGGLEATSSEKSQAEKDGKVTVTYRDHEGREQEREYSREVHGDNFVELSEEFKKANADRIV